MAVPRGGRRVCPFRSITAPQDLESTQLEVPQIKTGSAQKMNTVALIKNPLIYFFVLLEAEGYLLVLRKLFYSRTGEVGRHPLGSQNASWTGMPPGNQLGVRGQAVSPAHRLGREGPAEPLGKLVFPSRPLSGLQITS